MHKDDKQFVKEQINQVRTPKLKQDAWSGYKRVYQKAFDAEPVSFRKENKARRAANTALRSFVKKCMEFEASQ